MVGRVQRALESVGSLPGLRQLRQSQFDAAFAAGEQIGCCRGVFETAAEASRNAPPTRPLGYNHEDAAAMYRDRIDRVFASDYPMMFWLQKVFASGARSVYDLGGHIGLSYYAYRRFVDYPPGLEWTVHDLPAVIESGRKEAQHLDPEGRLKFSERTDVASGVDLFFTAGCLQYLEDTLAQRIGSLEVAPEWVMVNLLPLHDQREYWTVQSIGTAFCPYRIQHSSAFFNDMEALGYELIDRWENLDKACWVAFEPEYSLDRYHGAVFRKRR